MAFWEGSGPNASACVCGSVGFPSQDIAWASYNLTQYRLYLAMASGPTRWGLSPTRLSSAPEAVQVQVGTSTSVLLTDCL